MKLQSISSYVISNSLRSVVAKAQAELIKAQYEATSGMVYDKGLSLGGHTGTTISLRKEYDRLNALTETNGVVEQRMQASQLTMGKLVESAQTFLSNLTGLRASADGSSVLAQSAKTSLLTGIDLINTNLGGEYVFAGTNTDVKPMTGYETAGAGRDALRQAFQNHFGFPANDPQAANITAAEMEAFADGPLADEFSAANWTANWSSASDTVIKSRISPTELIETSTSANNEAFRKLTMSFAMIAEFADIGLNDSAYTALVDKAIGRVAEATSAISDQQSILGNAEARTLNANTRMKAQLNILNTSVLNMEAVDPYEATTRVENLIKQIETSYALTARLQNLSLLNYLR
ncbi:MAG: flagellar hook-associated family protein [Phyllobacterium sp.]